MVRRGAGAKSAAAVARGAVGGALVDIPDGECHQLRRVEPTAAHTSATRCAPATRRALPTRCASATRCALPTRRAPATRCAAAATEAAPCCATALSRSGTSSCASAAVVAATGGAAVATALSNDRAFRGSTHGSVARGGHPLHPAALATDSNRVQENTDQAPLAAA